jgi:hypothetical protein
MIPLNFRDSIIKKTLEKVAPTLDLDSADVRLLRMILEDFRNYEMWIREYGKISNLPSGDKSPKEIVEFIEIWVPMWWKKYKQRVKLQLNPRKEPEHLIKIANENLKSFSIMEQAKIITALIYEFIKYGEICASKILARDLFIRTLARCGKKKWTKEDKINLLVPLRKEVRAMARTHGILLFMRVGKKDYKLREFRDDGMAKGL